MQKLLAYINSLTGFSSESWEALQPALRKVTFKKDEYLLKEGEACNSLFFICDGLVRSFHDINGTEKNTAFYFEGEVATNITSFGTGEKSKYSIQAIEPVTAIVFDKQKLFEVGAIVPQIAILGKNCLRYTAAKLEECANLFTLYSPTERYTYFERNQPHMLQRVPLTLLASYLGVARETLSRIRSRRAESIL